MELQGLLLVLFFISMWPQLISKMTKNRICRWNTGQFRIRLEIYLERAAMKKKNEITSRSSAAEYLTYVAAVDNDLSKH